MRSIPAEQLPFPPLLVEISARQALMFDGDVSGEKDCVEIPMIAAYRLDDGTVHAAQDLYDPTYPQGGKPGLATLAIDGASREVFAFRPASEFLRDFPIEDMKKRATPWDSLAVAYFESESQSGFIFGFDEDEMRAWVDTAPENTAFTRHNITRCGVMDMHQGPREVLMISSGQSGNTFVATSKDTLAQALRDHYPGMNLPDDPSEAITKVAESADARGWKVAHREINPVAVGLQPGGCTCHSCVRNEVNRAAEACWGKPPHAAIVRAPFKMWMALLETENGNVILHAETSTDLTLHIARAALSMHGLDADAFGPAPLVSDRFAGAPPTKKAYYDDASHVISQIWDTQPGFYIWEEEGFAHLAHGTQPDSFAVILDGSGPSVTPKITCLAGSSMLSLEMAIEREMIPRLGLIPPCDFYDVRDAIYANPDYSMAIHTREDLIDALHPNRKDIDDTPEP